METLHISSEQELAYVAERVLGQLIKNKVEGCASVLALSGDLGAGKTTYMKALAKTLAISEEVTSPTFVLMKQYAIENKYVDFFSRLYHFDLYRVESLDELRPLHFAEILRDTTALVALEWAERADSLLPEHTVRLHINTGKEDTERVITLS